MPRVFLMLLAAERIPASLAADRAAFRELLKRHVVQKAEKIRKRKQGAHKE
jgi:hypothetical protein